jgi:tetratricopeptide (TPR) repeat protein
MAAGDAEMKRKQWPKARQQYTEALKIYSEGPLRARAQKSHSKAMFEEWLSTGQALLTEGDYRAALAYFLNAKKHATSEADAKRVDELIETCNKVLNPSQGSG